MHTTGSGGVDGGVQQLGIGVRAGRTETIRQTSHRGVDEPGDHQH